ncbi:MAG: 30S ribosomal protein S13 [Microgenomates bacterium OLB23]|nr:MAG: 30S ribosomal protein S13 [Microgenomates bacterium OLB23]
MIRISGRNLPDDKRIEYALTIVYGIGWKKSSEILEKLKIDTHTKVKDLTEEQVHKIQAEVGTFKVEGDLKEEINANIKRLREIGAYRGIRHLRGLPAHGQRTRSNARTRRGKRKTVGALKKEDLLRLQQAAAKK